MKFLNNVLLGAIILVSGNVIAKAVDYDKLHDQFMGMAVNVINKLPTPFEIYKGATVVDMDVHGTSIIWQINVENPSYFPGGENGISVAEMEKSIRDLLRGYCNKPFSNAFPISWIFRMVQMDNPGGVHPTYIVNTAEDC